MTKANRFLEEVFTTIKTQFRADDISGGMTAAQVGLVLRQQGIDFESNGYPKLRSLLEDISQHFDLSLDENSKGLLSVWIGPPPTFRLPQGRKAQLEGELSEPQRLKNVVWHAFVAEKPDGKRFINRQTGQIRINESETPSPASDWVEIPVIESDEERKQAREFLEKFDVEIHPEINEALTADNWFLELPRVINRDLGIRWKRQRTRNVVKRAKAWQSENKIPKHFIFDTAKPPTSITGQHNKSELRDLVLHAISQLSTDELLNLSIPIKNVVDALRPDLLND